MLATSYWHVNDLLTIKSGYHLGYFWTKMRQSTKIFIIPTSVILALVAIQVVWIFQLVVTKERIFNEKATIAIGATVGALNNDTELCSNMEGICNGKVMQNCPLRLTQTDEQKIDSVLRYYLNYYQLKPDYSLIISKNGKTISKTKTLANSDNKYVKKLPVNGGRDKIEFQLSLPGKYSYITKEIGFLFIASIALIFLISFFYIKTIISYRKEKLLAQRTTDFLNTITHEFNTPLTNIGLASKMLRKSVNTINQDKTETYFKILLNETEKLKSQVANILNVAALEKGELILNEQTIDLHEILKERLNCFVVQLEALEFKVHLQLSATNSVIWGDPDLLSNTFNNLIENALKYSPNTCELTITSYNQADMIYIEFADKGIGIAPENHALIFTNYFRVNTGNIHNVKGFGIGLAYVKKVIELHQGKILVNSELGHGATFKIILSNLK